VIYAGTEAARARRHGVVLGPENFCYRPRQKWSVVVDVGIGRGPTFAPWIQHETDAFVVLCDPTPRHLPLLRDWVSAHPGTDLFEAAVASVDGPVSFFESDEEESGSLDATHANRRTSGREVVVEGFSLETLLTRAARHGDVSLVKLDLEGAEFVALAPSARTMDVICQVPQWLVEFHPAPQTLNSLAAVGRIAGLFSKAGYRSFSRNGTDGLFYRD